MSEGSITCNEKLILLSSDILLRLLIFPIATFIYTCRSLRASILRSRQPNHVMCSSKPSQTGGCRIYYLGSGNISGF